jgi:hypothetical protein
MVASSMFPLFGLEQAASAERKEQITNFLMSSDGPANGTGWPHTRHIII